MFKKTQKITNKQQKIAELIFNIGWGLINDLKDPKNAEMTLTQYGEKLLNDYPLLTELKNTYKEGSN